MALHQIAFTDLHLPGGRSDLATCARLLGIPGDRAPRPVPEDARDDVRRLADLVAQEDGRARRLTFDGVPYRVTRIRHLRGETLVLARGMPHVPRLGELGVAPAFARALIQLGADRRPGLILVSGPMRGGKTTLAAAVLKEWLCGPGGYGYTLEDPAELDLELDAFDGRGFCHQFEVLGDAWSEAAEAALRSRADYFLVGEIRSPQSARRALELASKGHPTVATCHGGDPYQSLVTLAGLVAPEHQPTGFHKLAETLVSVVDVRLVDQGARRSIHALGFVVGEADIAVRSILREGKVRQLADVLERQAHQFGIPDRPV